MLTFSLCTHYSQFMEKVRITEKAGCQETVNQTGAIANKYNTVSKQGSGESWFFRVKVQDARGPLDQAKMSTACWRPGHFSALRNCSGAQLPETSNEPSVSVLAWVTPCCALDIGFSALLKDFGITLCCLL